MVKDLFMAVEDVLRKSVHSKIAISYEDIDSQQTEIMNNRTSDSSQNVIQTDVSKLNDSDLFILNQHKVE